MKKLRWWIARLIIGKRAAIFNVNLHRDGLLVHEGPLYAHNAKLVYDGERSEDIAAVAPTPDEEPITFPPGSGVK